MLSNRVMECLHDRWNHRCGTVYESLSSDMEQAIPARASTRAPTKPQEARCSNGFPSWNRPWSPTRQWPRCSAAPGASARGTALRQTPTHILALPLHRRDIPQGGTWRGSLESIHVSWNTPGSTNPAGRPAQKCPISFRLIEPGLYLSCDIPPQRTAYPPPHEIPMTDLLVLPPPKRSRSRRLRKKLHIGEFQVLGFDYELTWRVAPSIDVQDRFIDQLLEDLVVPRALSLGGGGNCGFVVARRGSVTDADRGLLVFSAISDGTKS